MTPPLQHVQANVVVGNDKPVRRNKRAGPAAVETDGGLLQVVEPGSRLLEFVAILEELEGRVGVKIHSLVGAAHSRDHKDYENS